MTNIAYNFPAGIPSLELDTTSLATHIFTVPINEKWLILNAGNTNVNRASATSVRWSMDGTNFTGTFEGPAGSAASRSRAVPDVFPIVLDSGGKIEVRALAFTAADVMIHHVTYMKLFSQVAV